MPKLPAVIVPMSLRPWQHVKEISKKSDWDDNYDYAIDLGSCYNTGIEHLSHTVNERLNHTLDAASESKQATVEEEQK